MLLHHFGVILAQSQNQTIRFKYLTHLILLCKSNGLADLANLAPRMALPKIGTEFGDGFAIVDAKFWLWQAVSIAACVELSRSEGKEEKKHFSLFGWWREGEEINKIEC